MGLCRYRIWPSTDCKPRVRVLPEEQELPLEVIEFDKNQKKIVLSVREYFKDKDQAEYEAYLAEHPVQEVAAEEAAADKDDEMESWERRPRR